MIAPGTRIGMFAGGPSTVLGHAQSTIRLRTIDGREIVRRLDKMSEQPKDVYRLSCGNFLSASEYPPDSGFVVVAPWPIGV